MLKVTVRDLKQAANVKKVSGFNLISVTDKKYRCPGPRASLSDGWEEGEEGRKEGEKVPWKKGDDDDDDGNDL